MSSHSHNKTTELHPEFSLFLLEAFDANPADKPHGYIRYGQGGHIVENYELWYEYKPLPAKQIKNPITHEITYDTELIIHYKGAGHHNAPCGAVSRRTVERELFAAQNPRTPGKLPHTCDRCAKGFLRRDVTVKRVNEALTLTVCNNCLTEVMK